MARRLARVRTPERMDSPAIDPAEHRRALRGLARLNRLSGAAGALWPELRSFARERALGANGAEPLRVLDVATGSGDIPVALALAARAVGLSIEWHALDASPLAAAEAAARASRRGVTLRTHVGGAAGEVDGTPFDVVTCSLFLHHLDPDGARDALRRMAASVRSLVLVSDLRRTRLGLALAAAAPRLVTRSRVVWHDAAASVRAAYTLEELRALAAEAGMRGASVRRVWPQRMLLVWRRSP